MSLILDALRKMEQERKARSGAAAHAGHAAEVVVQGGPATDVAPLLLQLRERGLVHEARLIRADEAATGA